MINLTKFKIIPGYKNYMISESGYIYPIKRKKIIAINKNFSGYLTVTITDDSGFRSPRKVHRLVYLTYVGPLIDGMTIDHIDDNKYNNHYTNLQQITPSENSLKQFITGKNKDKVICTIDQIKTICELMERNFPIYKIIDSLGLDYYSKPTTYIHFIGLLRRKAIYQDITKDYNIQGYICAVNKKDRVFDIPEVQNIYMRLLFGEKIHALSKEYHVTDSTIQKIRDKKTWKTSTDAIDHVYFEDWSSTIIPKGSRSILRNV